MLYTSSQFLEGKYIIHNRCPKGMGAWGMTSWHGRKSDGMELQSSAALHGRRRHGGQGGRVRGAPTA